MRNMWMDEGEVRTTVPVEKIHEAELWREATIASPLPLALAAFAVATFAAGLAAATGAPLLGVIPIVVMFGGITLWVMALFFLRKGSTLASTFAGIVGSYNIVWPIYYVYATTFAPAGMLANIATGMAVFLFLTAFIVFYLFLCAMRANVAFSLVILTLFLSLLATGLGLLAASPALVAIGGWMSVISAIIAFYTSFAIIWNSAAHKEQLPLVSERRPVYQEARTEA